MIASGHIVRAENQKRGCSTLFMYGHYRRSGQQILREHRALRQGLKVAFGSEMKGEVWLPKARAGGSVPGHPNREGGELGEYPKGRKQGRERGMNHFLEQKNTASEGMGHLSLG